MRTRTKVTTLAVLGALVLTVIVAVQPVFACEYGCTPGFWKNLRQHGWAWERDPDEGVCDVFSEAAAYVDCGDSLHDALSYGGGPGDEGAARILLRAAVAALLNAAYDDAISGSWDWGWWYDNLEGEVNGALVSGRGEMLWLASHLDGWNNEGCPLGRAPD